MMNDLFEYRPEILPRRGELSAWILTSLSGAAWLVMEVTSTQKYFGILILFVFFLLSALIISLGNWMDRHTQIVIHENSILFQDGLRLIDLSWDEIQHVEIYPSKWGNKVRVLGNERRINYRTLGEISLKGEVKGRMGFIDGEEITNKILDKSQLKQVNISEEGVYYYSRK